MCAPSWAAVLGFAIFRRKHLQVTDPAEFPTVIGEYMTYRGDIAGKGSYLVHGRVEGNCDIDGHLEIGPTAHWHGGVAATHVIVSGEVVGDVYASARLELHATARIHGSISSPVIAMAEGALYDGEIRVRPRPPLARSDEKQST